MLHSYYAMRIEIPMDKRGTGTKPTYKVRTEADVNSYDSDLWMGRETTTVPPFTALNAFKPPQSCPSSNEACPLPVSAVQPRTPNRQNVKMPCVGETFTVTVSPEGNPSFFENGGSYAEGLTRHSCDIKIVKVEAGVNSKATFHLFTDVPIPSRWKGVVLDDRLPQSNPRATLYTELLGIPHMPVGIRDFTGTQLTVVETDVSMLPLFSAVCVCDFLLS